MKNIKEITFKIKFNFIKYQKNKKHDYFNIYIKNECIYFFSTFYIFIGKSNINHKLIMLI